MSCNIGRSSSCPSIKAGFILCFLFFLCMGDGQGQSHGASKISYRPDTLFTRHVAINGYRDDTLFISSTGTDSLRISQQMLHPPDSNRFRLIRPVPRTIAPGATEPLIVRSYGWDFGSTWTQIILLCSDVSKNMVVVPVIGNVIVGVQTPPVYAEVPILHANLPNPFSDKTLLRFSIARQGHVTIRLYDLHGCDVATVHDAFIQAGTHNVRFESSALPTGLYICVLSSQWGHASRMVLRVR
jgi:hypothetical protein